jgi:hypothetical protein
MERWAMAMAITSSRVAHTLAQYHCSRILQYPDIPRANRYIHQEHSQPVSAPLENQMNLSEANSSHIFPTILPILHPVIDATAIAKDNLLLLALLAVEVWTVLKVQMVLVYVTGSSVSHYLQAQHAHGRLNQISTPPGLIAARPCES